MTWAGIINSLHSQDCTISIRFRNGSKHVIEQDPWLLATRKGGLLGLTSIGSVENRTIWFPEEDIIRIEVSQCSIRSTCQSTRRRSMT